VRRLLPLSIYPLPFLVQKDTIRYNPVLEGTALPASEKYYPYLGRIDFNPISAKNDNTLYRRV
jgi:hypothetical protein